MQICGLLFTNTPPYMFSSHELACIMGQAAFIQKNGLFSYCVNLNY